jgi:hypothetical protein
MDTVYLDPAAWDMVLDSSGNFAKASDVYSLAQDAASAIRCFKSECWYDTTVGVPYWTQTLGKQQPLAQLKAQWVAAALTVPEVTAAQVFVSDFNGRKVSGQVQVTNSTGNIVALGF